MACRIAILQGEADAGRFASAIADSEDAPAEALLEHLNLALCEPVEPPRDTAAYLR